MILEVAEIYIHEGKNTEFEAALHQSMEKYIRTSPGCLHVELYGGIEQPTRYVLLIKWETLEAHTVTFRESENFQRHRELINPFFAKPPFVEHFELK